ncbi:choline kinase family protein [Campylobacter pinnipediorum]|uniref:choline kinase family protein n=1 Tax=Campylobacter pinnipediorum TaxID=1965231 RepID=UPI00084DE7DA|nr:choline kinase family protein [Campylobacter pinnipediorum]
MSSEDKINLIFNSKLNIKLDYINALGGMTNFNFLAQSGQNKFVVRLPGNSSNNMINREFEKINQTESSKYGFNVETLFFCEESGVKITRFLDNSQTLKQETVCNYLTLIAVKLKEIHDSDMKFKNLFDPSYELKKYLALIDSNSFNIFNNLKKLFDLFDNLVEKINFINKNNKNYKLVPTHGDLVPENILYCEKDKRIYIIDWEYSGLNDICWDIASLFLEGNLSKKQENIFLDAYKIKDNEYEKIKIFKSIQDILWCTWTLVKLSNKNITPHKRKEYIQYASKRLENALLRKC